MNGRRIKAIAQVSKQGFTYVFDRTNGRPVWPIEERPVPPAEIPGEELSPTQPFPTRPPAFEYQGVSEDMLIDFTPALRAEAIKIMQRYRYGPIFTPQTLAKEGGHAGLAAAAGFQRRRELGRIGRRSRDRIPLRAVAHGPDENGACRRQAELHRSARTSRAASSDPKAIHPAPLPPPNGPEGLPLIKPPYSRMTAYNLNTGEIAWQVPTGPGQDGIRNHQALKGLNLPALGGQGGQGGPLVTKTLLIYGLMSCRPGRYREARRLRQGHRRDAWGSCACRRRRWALR